MAFEKFSLSERTVPITGGAGLLGIEHTAALLESGATVVLTDIGKDSLNTARNTLANHCSQEKFIHI